MTTTLLGANNLILTRANKPLFSPSVVLQEQLGEGTDLLVRIHDLHHLLDGIRGLELLAAANLHLNTR